MGLHPISGGSIDDLLFYGGDNLRNSHTYAAYSGC